MATWQDDQRESDVTTRDRVQKPPNYKVLLHNDDYTTMAFVVKILCEIFHLSSAASTRTMLRIHKTGRGVAGVYTRDVAETLVAQVIEISRAEGHPLQCTMEPES